MHIDELFPSRFLKWTDLKGKNVRLTIKGVSIEEFDDGRKPALAFEGTDKLMTLNKTNALVIADMYGPETTKWPGNQIVVAHEKVLFAGKMTDTIRVHRPRPPDVDYQAPITQRRDMEAPTEAPAMISPAAEVSAYAAAKNGTNGHHAPARGNGRGVLNDEIPF